MQKNSEKPDITPFIRPRNQIVMRVASDQFWVVVCWLLGNLVSLNLQKNWFFLFNCKKRKNPIILLQKNGIFCYFTVEKNFKILSYYSFTIYIASVVWNKEIFDNIIKIGSPPLYFKIFRNELIWLLFKKFTSLLAYSSLAVIENVVNLNSKINFQLVI